MKIVSLSYSFTYEHQRVLAEARDRPTDHPEDEAGATCLESVAAISHRMKLQNTSQAAEMELRQSIKSSGRFSKGAQ
jgi:hypothetical protein